MAEHLDNNPIKKNSATKAGLVDLFGVSCQMRRDIMQTHWYHPHICQCQSWLWYLWFTVIPLEKK